MALGLNKEELKYFQWRKRLKRRRLGRKKGGHGGGELNLVAMMDIMTIILVFLMKSYSGSTLTVETSKNFTFPKSSQVISPMDATKLTVTNVGQEDSKIMLDSDVILDLDSKTVAKLKRNAKRKNFLLPELFKALKEQATLAKDLVQGVEGEKFEGKILVIADKEVPYWLLTTILYTSAESGFDKYNLVAVKKNQ